MYACGVVRPTLPLIHGCGGLFSVSSGRMSAREQDWARRLAQTLPFVRPDRVAVMGWSQGGGVILFGVRADSLGRPADLPHGDFKAAVAFHPGSCRDQAHRLPWTSNTPVLVLLGEHDNWTPTEPCQRFVDAAVRRARRSS